MRFSPIGKHWEIYEFKITFRHTFMRHQQQHTRTHVIVFTCIVFTRKFVGTYIAMGAS